MKIVFLFDSLGPYHIARLTETAKLEDIVCIQAHNTSNEYRWDRNLKLDFPVVSLYSGSENKTTTEQFISQRIIHALNQIRPNLLFVPGWESLQSVSAARWACINRTPFVVMSASQQIDFPREFIKENWKKYFLGLSIGALVGGARQLTYCIRLGMDKERIRTGYNTVDNDHFSSAVAEPSVEGSPITFLVVARLIPKKNIQLLLHSFADLIKGNADIRARLILKIAGEGPMLSNLEETCANLQLENNVKFLGHVSYFNLPRLYRDSSVLVLPSLSEQWGLVVNEAMSAGLPVIVSDACGCSDDLVRDGVNGFVFESGNREQLTYIMQRFIEAPYSARYAMGENSKAIISFYSTARFQRAVSSFRELAMKDQRNYKLALAPYLLYFYPLLRSSYLRMQRSRIL
jgi:1,2-diacylglycerol 3-alpha-glucosyltransferase